MVGFKGKGTLGSWLAWYPVWLRCVDPRMVACCKYVLVTPSVGVQAVLAVGRISYP